MKRFLLLCTIALAFITSKATAQDAAAGRQTFSTICTACHAVGKQVIGPDLKDVHKLRTEDWLIKFIHSPQKLRSSGDTAAVNLFNQFKPQIMLDNGGLPNLTDKDIKNIIAYIAAQSDSLDKAATAAPATASATNAENPPYVETGIVHRLIFLDEPGHHVPLSFSDYSAWLALIVAVVLLAVVLVMVVNMQELKSKYFDEKNDEENL